MLQDISADDTLGRGYDHVILSRFITWSMIWCIVESVGQIPRTKCHNYDSTLSSGLGFPGLLSSEDMHSRLNSGKAERFCPRHTMECECHCGNI